jgi:hypothetical protein
MDQSLWGAIIGCCIGIAGGALGTYFGIKNTKGPKERAWMIKCTTIIWIAVIVFLTLLRIVPYPYKVYLWIPYAILLSWGIFKINRRQRALREEDKAKPQKEEPL